MEGARRNAGGGCRLARVCALRARRKFASRLRPSFSGGFESHSQRVRISGARFVPRGFAANHRMGARLYTESQTMRTIALLVLAASAFCAQTFPIEELIETARQGPSTPGLKDRITKTLGAHGGQNVWGQDFLFVADSPSPVTI